MLVLANKKDRTRIIVPHTRSTISSTAVVCWLPRHQHAATAIVLPHVLFIAREE